MRFFRQEETHHRLEHANEVEAIKRWYAQEIPENGMLSLHNALQAAGLLTAVSAISNCCAAPLLNTNAALLELIAFIDRNKWEEIPEYRVAARIIENLSSSPLDPVATKEIERLKDNLLSLRQPASHYSYIFMQRMPVTGEKFDGSYSPEGLISSDEKHALAGFLEETARPGMRVAEIGSFLGRGSTRTIAESVRKHGGSFVCIDDFPVFGGFVDQRELFEQSTTALGIRNLINVIEGNGREVATRFPDNYFDLVYVDAGHTYDDLDADITAWLPKVRHGGILCGHDCIRHLSEFSDDHVAALQKCSDSRATTLHMPDPRDPRDIVLTHPGVILAVAKHFGKDAKVYAKPLGVWCYRVPV